MNDALASAHTWFLESYAQGPRGDLVIHLVEGIKGPDRLPVEVVAGTTLGHFFPITIERESRCATIHFSEVRSVFTFAESFDAADPQLKMEDHGLARKAEASSFREFVRARTTAIEEFRGEFSEWVVWTEDQVFHVISDAAPVVSVNDRSPYLSIERGKTWSAS
jgi:hypothetical protein